MQMSMKTKDERGQKKATKRHINTVVTYFRKCFEAMAEQTSVKAGWSVDTDRLAHLFRRTFHFEASKWHVRHIVTD